MAETKQMGALPHRIWIPFVDSSTGKPRLVPPLSEILQPVEPEYTWTKALDGYDEAFESIDPALRRLLTTTKAWQCNHNSKTPRLDAYIHEIASGTLTAQDLRMLDVIKCAQKEGLAEEVLAKRIPEALWNLKRRKNREKTFLWDIDPLRKTIIEWWLGGLLWLMSDRLIGDFLLTRRLIENAERTTINTAVVELQLFRGPQIVQALAIDRQTGKCGYMFKPGYPPKEQAHNAG